MVLRSFVGHLTDKSYISSQHPKMPTVLRIGSFRFHFYSDEGNEPSHIQVATSDGECKFWLHPVKLARNKNLKPHEIKEIEHLVFENSDVLKLKFNEFHHR